MLSQNPVAVTLTPMFLFPLNPQLATPLNCKVNVLTFLTTSILPKVFREGSLEGAMEYFKGKTPNNYQETTILTIFQQCLNTGYFRNPLRLSYIFTCFELGYP